MSAEEFLSGHFFFPFRLDSENFEPAASAGDDEVGENGPGIIEIEDVFIAGPPAREGLGPFLAEADAMAPAKALVRLRVSMAM